MTSSLFFALDVIHRMMGKRELLLENHYIINDIYLEEKKRKLLN